MTDQSNQNKRNLAMTPPRILIAVTNCRAIDPDHQTGVWFEEFAVPVMLFQANGLSMTIASPRGGHVPVDPRSEPGVGDATLAVRALLWETKPLHEVRPLDYDAIFLPGGHGAMFDLPSNITLGRLLSDFAQQGKVIAAVCHGPAGFIGARRADGTPLVAGKRLTAFTNEEEAATGLDRLMPFLLESRLCELGARFIAQPTWSEHIEVDGTLITGQNPQSSRSLALAMLEVLKND
jgi:putative intracellular protease/amidase